MIVGSVECITSVKNELGEGPLWHAAENTLYWVDISQSQVLTFRPAIGDVASFDVDPAITALGLYDDKRFIVACKTGFGIWDKSDLRILANPEEDKSDSRFNDGAVDCNGRFWAGTTAPAATSSLYMLNTEFEVSLKVPGITVSNGIGWTTDCQTMYFTDSRIHTIYAFDFDPATGSLSNQRIFSHTPTEEGVPDGLAVDSENFIWSARWGGSKLTRYSPDGTVDLELDLPVKYPTSCTFGGSGLSDLYITSARLLIPPEQRVDTMLDGCLMKVKTTTRGQPEYNFGKR